MDVRNRLVRVYVHRSGREPFQNWFNRLKDRKVRAAILARIDRVRSGNFGDHKHLGGGLYELRIRYGAGYRVYFGNLDETIVIILCGGSKKTKQRDIEKARGYWQEFRSRTE